VNQGVEVAFERIAIGDRRRLLGKGRADAKKGSRRE
jgi:hypothetical protein